MNKFFVITIVFTHDIYNKSTQLNFKFTINVHVQVFYIKYLDKYI